MASSSSSGRRLSLSQKPKTNPADLLSRIEGKHSTCNGLAVIITNDYDSQLPCTHNDGEAIEKAFGGLDFATYWLKNASHDQFKDLLSQITKIPNEVYTSDFHCIAFMFSGRYCGETDVLEVQDNGKNRKNCTIHLCKDIIRPLSHHQQLATIPKLFFIDACKGAEAAPGEVCQTGTVSKSEAKSETLHPSAASNYFLAYSTIPKCTGIGAPGSIWVQKIAQLLRQRVDSVQNIVATATKIVWDEQPQESDIEQPKSKDKLTCGALNLRPDSPFSPPHKTFRKYKLSDKDLPGSIPLIIPPGYDYDSEKHRLKKQSNLEQTSLKNGLKLFEQAVEILQSIDKPVAVLSICGPYRTGKSYFLSRFLGMKEAFKLGHTTNACTKGIWLSTTALICEEYVLIILDSEGIDAAGEGETSDSFSTSILTLTNLLTSFLIYNSSSVPEKKDLIAMSCFTELSASIIVQDQGFQNEASLRRLQQQLPHFCWLLRNVELCDGAESVNNHVRNEVLHYPSMHPDSEDLGHKLLTLYPGLECLDLPRPGCKNKEMFEESKLNKKFTARFAAVATHILQKMTVKKGYTLKPLNGASLACLARQYVTALNTPGTIPNLEQCWVKAVEQNLYKATEQLVQMYDKEMNEELSGKYPLEELDVTKIHERVLGSRTSTLKSKAEQLLAIPQEKLPENDAYRQAEQDLRNQIVIKEQERVVGGKLLSFIENNRRASYEQCNKLFQSLCACARSTSESLKKKDIEKKYYARAIGPEKNEVFRENIKNIPGRPRNLHVTELTHSKVKINWNMPELADTKLEYEVQITKVGNSDEFPPAEETSNCFVILDSLTPVTKYQVWVRAVNKTFVGEGEHTTFNTKPGPPNKPRKTSISTSISINPSSLFEIKIPYKQPTEADMNGSKITQVIIKYRKLGFRQPEELTIKEVSIKDTCDNCISVKLDNVTTPNICYAFELHFANEIGESEPSDKQIFNTMEMIPGPPQKLMVDGRGHERIKLRWYPPIENPATVVEYIVEIKTLQDESFEEICRKNARTPEISAVAKNLDYDAKYKFRVKAINCNGNGEYTQEFEDWVETKYHPAIRAALVAGAAVGGTAAAPFVATGGPTAASAVVVYKGIQKRNAKQIAAGVLGMASAPITAVAGLVAGTVCAPVGGGIAAKKAYDKLDSDDDLADSDNEPDEVYQKRREKSRKDKNFLSSHKSTSSTVSQ